MASLTRKFLASLGIEEDKADQIFERHNEVLTEIKDERDRYKADAEKLPGVQQELDAAKAAAENDDGYEAKYNTLKSEYDLYKAQIAAEQETAKKRSAYRGLLGECGIPEKRLDAVLRLIDLDKVTLGTDGTIADVENVKKQITEDWGDYIPKDENHGASTVTPPGGAGGSGGGTPSRAAQVAQKHYEAIYGKKES